MKEFEKWWEGVTVSDLASNKTISEYSWKAALEWALKHVEKHDLNYEFVKLLEKEIENK